MFVNCYLVDYILAPLIQCENMFQLKFISMTKSFYRRTLGTSIKSTLTVIESHLAMLFSKNRLASYHAYMYKAI